MGSAPRRRSGDAARALPGQNCPRRACAEKCSFRFPRTCQADKQHTERLVNKKNILKRSSARCQQSGCDPLGCDEATRVCFPRCKSAAKRKERAIRAALKRLLAATSTPAPVLRRQQQCFSGKERRNVEKKPDGSSLRAIGNRQCGVPRVNKKKTRRRRRKAVLFVSPLDELGRAAGRSASVALRAKAGRCLGGGGVKTLPGDLRQKEWQKMEKSENGNLTAQLSVATAANRTNRIQGRANQNPFSNALF